MYTADQFNQMGASKLPGHLGVVITHVSADEVRGRMSIAPAHMAPNGYLHAASVIALADSCTGFATIANLPPGATSFTTVELKSNHLGTAREGVVECTAKPVHRGKTTQVWDATVTQQATGKTIALYRCTQVLLYPKTPA